MKDNGKMAANSGAAVGVVGLFDSPKSLMEAIPLVREKCQGRIEAYTPYPVHGLSEALGQKGSPLGIMVFLAALAGAGSGLLLQWWTSSVDYPVEIGGKALFSWQAFVPIMFEVTVLFATFTAGLGMISLLNRLPFFGAPILKSRAICSTTRDRFALAVEVVGGEADACSSALSGAGAAEIEVLLREEYPPPKKVLPPLPLLIVLLACAVSGAATYFGIKLFPTLPPMSNMGSGRHFAPFKPSSLFKDGAAMRPHAEGSVARGNLPLVARTAEEADSLANPLPTTLEVMERGRNRFEIYCRVCHGAFGDGNAELSKAYGGKPANLQSSTFLGCTDWRIFSAITAGKGTMPSYASEIEPADRWAIVRYVRALQRSQNAREEDFK